MGRDSAVENYRDLLKSEAEFWDRHFAEASYARFAHEVAYIRDRVTHPILAKIAERIRPGDTVLDFGCGTGWFSLMLAPSRAEITGLDIAPKCIEEASAKAAAAGFKNCHFECADLNEHELPPNAFNAVVAFGALHHLLRLDHALDQINRSLKADGVLMVYECVDREGIRGKLADFLADVFHMILPTDLTYGQKLRHAWRKLTGKKPEMQELSPLEGVGSGNWLAGLTDRFDVVYKEEWYGFITPFIGRIRPRILGLDLVKVMFQIDRILVKARVLPPEIHFVIARKKEAS